MIPAYFVAIGDNELPHITLVVYLHLLDLLDNVTYREVKQVALATKLQKSERSVRTALKDLTKRGYLRRRRAPGGRERQYRLVYSKMP